MLVADKTSLTAQSPMQLARQQAFYQVLQSTVYLFCQRLLANCFPGRRVDLTPALMRAVPLGHFALEPGHNIEIRIPQTMRADCGICTPNWHIVITDNVLTGGYLIHTKGEVIRFLTASRLF